MLVLYFFQGEPGECMDVPNGFMVSSTHWVFVDSLLQVSTYCRFLKMVQLHLAILSSTSLKTLVLVIVDFVWRILRVVMYG